MWTLNSSKWWCLGETTIWSTLGGKFGYFGIRKDVKGSSNRNTCHYGDRTIDTNNNCYEEKSKISVLGLPKYITTKANKQRAHPYYSYDYYDMKILNGINMMNSNVSNINSFWTRPNFELCYLYA